MMVAVLAVGMAGPANAGAAFSIGPLSLYKGKGSVPALQVPASSLLSFSFSIQQGGSSKGWGGGGYAPKSTSELFVTKLPDATHSFLEKAALSGTHFKVAALTLKQKVIDNPVGEERVYCLTDVFVASYKASALSGSGHGDETIGFAYDKFKLLNGGVGAQPCAGESPPPVTTSLLGVREGGSSLLARVDCLSPRCRGILTVEVPSAACRLGGERCSFTGGVRVGLNGGGKVHFNGDGTATLNGGDQVGINGAGGFSLGDGSVKILHLAVPPPLQKWLAAHPHALLGAIIVVRGSSTAFVEHEVMGASTKLPPGAPSGTLETPGGPTELQQSLALTSCTGAHPVGTPATVVVVSGSLAPARGGAGVTLTYTPVTGPPPLPSPVVHSVVTDPAGSFSENFDREVAGQPYSWNVVASIPAGGGYGAAQSASCAIPIP